MEPFVLSTEQVGQLQLALAQTKLENYEFIWVLEGCLTNPSSQVYCLGPVSQPLGLLIIHRQCMWVRVQREDWLELLLTKVPSQPLLKFYATETDVLDMLMRWFPGGEFTETSLLVRKLSKSWRRRFEVQVQSVGTGRDMSGELYYVYNGNELVAAISAQSIVHPYQELVSWQFYAQDSYYQWQEQIFGAVSAFLLDQEIPVVVRSGDEHLVSALTELGYRTFSPLYYYISAEDLLG